MTRQSVAVTGATGYIGYNLVSRLLRDRRRVHVIVRPHSQLDLLKRLTGDVVIHTYDGDFASLDSIMGSARPEIVFHLGSLFLAKHTAADIAPLIESNIHFGTQLLEAMVGHNVFHLINTGSYWQHYKNESYNPACLYAAMKQAFETVARYYSETTPLSMITLRLFDVYGPGDRRPKLFSLLRQAACNGEPLSMSPGEQLLDLVYIDDVVEAYIQAASFLESLTPINNAVYSVSSGAPLPLKDVVAIYGRVTGKALPILWGQRPYRTREVMVPWNTGDSLPGWHPTVGLEEGIRRMEGGEEYGCRN